MSIYSRRGWDNVGELHPKAAVPENTPSGDSSAGSQDWSKLRKAKPAEHLQPSSKKFLDQLPPEVFPGALASQYARIVNLIALQWHDRGSCDIYFKDGSSLTGETPRLCRGGSSSLTFEGVHRRNFQP